MKVLIAEDSVTQAERLRRILEGEGLQVAVAANGRIALEMTEEFRPALIISDVVMPEMDGYELFRRVKADSVHRDVALILVTTMTEPQDVIRGLECGADDFVLKPYEPDTLLAHVRSVMAHRNAPAAEESGSGVEIELNGEKHIITADRSHILTLLLSTYDAIVERNSQLQRSREELQAANTTLSEANRGLEAFSYSASHDLRAPLRHISGFSGLLLNEIKDRLSPQAMHYLQEITAATGRMARLIEDLLQFSRVDRAHMERGKVDLEALVRECIADLRFSTQGRQIVWQVAALPMVVGDAAMLRQVFANVIGNAVKYTARRDPAVIEIGSSTKGAREVAVFVRDNGAGFDMKLTNKLFQPFQRLHGSDEFEGTGIGLATVRRVVERHGGRVWAEAAPEKGAVFYLTLPLFTP